MVIHSCLTGRAKLHMCYSTGAVNVACGRTVASSIIICLSGPNEDCLRLIKSWKRRTNVWVVLLL